MLHTACQWAAWLLGPAGLMLLAFALVRRLRRGPALALCPGPRPAFWRRVLPDRWVLIRGCRYDLSGAAAAADGSVVCPECGRRLPPPHRPLTHAHRWRPALTGALCLLVALAGYRASVERWLRPEQSVPTTLLILARHAAGAALPTRVVREFDRRVNTETPNSLQARLLIPLLVRDLRDDEQRWNAAQAWDLLGSLGNDAVPALEGALTSDDWQQRVYAARILLDRPGFMPTPEVVRVMLQALRSDARGHWSVSSVLRELTHYPGRVEPCLGEALDSDDEQQRFLAAVVAGFNRSTRLADRAAPILVEHLRDNGWSDDAKLAAPALYRLGPAAMPWLEAALTTGDVQQRKVAELILLDLTSPPATESDHRARAAYNPITRLVHDPAAEFEIDSFWITRLGP